MNDSSKFQITERDKKLIIAMCQTAIFNRQMLIKMGFSDWALRKLRHLELINFSVYFNEYSKRFVEVYYLTNKGQNYARRHLAIQYIYKSSPRQISHDLCLSQFYVTHEIKNWVNETELLCWKFPDKPEPEQCVDAICTFMNEDSDEVQTTAIEVITPNYSPKKINAKIFYATECLKLPVRLIEMKEALHEII